MLRLMRKTPKRRPMLRKRNGIYRITMGIKGKSEHGYATVTLKSMAPLREVLKSGERYTESRGYIDLATAINVIEIRKPWR